MVLLQARGFWEIWERPIEVGERLTGPGTQRGRIDEDETRIGK